MTSCRSLVVGLKADEIPYLPRISHMFPVNLDHLHFLRETPNSNSD